MKRSSFAALAAFMALSCAHPVRRPDPSHTNEGLVIRIWIETSPNLAPEDMLKGCEAWAVKGIRCAIVTDRRASEVQVYDDPKNECKPDKDGVMAIAWAHAGGKIVMHTPCMRKWYKFGSLDRDEVRAVFTHEIGHQLGIWNHVPNTCDLAKINPKTSKLKTHPNGTKICGKAIMNPAYDPSVDFVTLLDGLAFDLRDAWSAVVSDPETPPEVSEEPGCVYYRK